MDFLFIFIIFSFFSFKIDIQSQEWNQGPQDPSQSDFDFPTYKPRVDEKMEGSIYDANRQSRLNDFSKIEPIATVHDDTVEQSLMHFLLSKKKSPRNENAGSVNAWGGGRGNGNNEEFYNNSNNNNQMGGQYQDKGGYSNNNSFGVNYGNNYNCGSYGNPPNQYGNNAGGGNSSSNNNNNFRNPPQQNVGPNNQRQMEQQQGYRQPQQGPSRFVDGQSKMQGYQPNNQNPIRNGKRKAKNN